MTDLAARRLAADKLWDSMFSTRVVNCLVAEGICTLEQLSQMSDAELLRLPYFGPVCLREVRAVISDPTICPTCHGSGRVLR